MYSLDVNFLKDRPGRVPEPGLDSQSKPRQTSDRTPLIIGLVVGLLLPGLVGGLWLFLQQQNASLAQQKAELDSQLQAQQAERQKITTLNKQTEQVRTETTALATVFNQVKPWSAMLQDIRERIPPGVQIRNIEQVEVAPPTTPTPAASPSPSPAASPGANAAAASTARPTVNLKISGTARSFDDVNFFLLTLQRSSFFKGDETQLLNAQLIANPTKLEVPQTQNQLAAPVNQVKYELPKVVEYTIQTSLSDVPASELLRELDRKGAVGLVTRIRTLQEITKE